MTVDVTSSLPRTIFRGVKDDAATNLTMPVENLPIRLGLFFTLAAWGDETKASYCDASAAELLYGAEMLNPQTPFFTHQSQFIRSTFTAGGKALLLRVASPNAKSANMRLAYDFVKDNIPTYERNVDGSYKLDVNGEKVPTGDTIPGTRIQWRKVAITPVSAEDPTLSFGSASPTDGTMVSSIGGEISTMNPFTDFMARFRGAKGRNFGIRLTAPTVNSTTPADADLQDALGAFLYRLQVVTRATEKSTAVVKRTLSSEDSRAISFKPGTINLDTEVQYYAGKVVLPSYESRDATSFTGYGPFEKMHCYDALTQAFLAELAAAETLFTGEEIADANLVNFLTGVDVNGIPYHTFVVEGPAQGGILFSELTNHFMIGGDDGDTGQVAYNSVVDTLLDTLEDSPIPFRNIARMPYDSVWDSGFPVATKLKFSKFLSLRPDVLAHICTQDVLKPLNTPSEDTSIGITIRSHFRATQESSEFGTKALRVAVMANAGYLINDNYDGIVPFMEQLLIKGAAYMGAENGAMDGDNNFGRGELNIITRYRDHNVGDKLEDARNTDWNNGLNYAEYYDMSRLFWAGLQSIYENHTSVLHGYLNVCIACNLTRLGHITWREMSGDSQYTDDQFLDQVQNKMVVRTTGKYDNRVDVTPTAYYTELDAKLGTAWHLDVGMAGDNIRTTESLAIIAQNRRNIAEAA